MTRSAFHLFLSLFLAVACGRSPAPKAQNGGDVVPNGGGVGEQNVLLAFSLLPESLPRCLKSLRCELTAEERKLVSRISTALKERRETAAQVTFRTGTEMNFSLATVGGAVRSALTGTEVGSPIYVNRDHLTVRSGNAAPAPISKIESQALILHELAHHQGIGNTPDELRRLDEMCSKFTLFLEPERLLVASQIMKYISRNRDAYTCLEPAIGMTGVRTENSFGVASVARKLGTIRRIPGGGWLVMTTAELEIHSRVRNAALDSRPPPMIVVYAHAIRTDEEAQEISDVRTSYRALSASDTAERELERLITSDPFGLDAARWSTVTPREALPAPEISFTHRWDQPTDWLSPNSVSIMFDYLNLRAVRRIRCTTTP